MGARQPTNLEINATAYDAIVVAFMNLKQLENENQSQVVMFDCNFTFTESSFHTSVQYQKQSVVFQFL